MRQPSVRLERDVRIHVHTSHHDEVIDEPLVHEKVEIERVAVGRPVDAAPPIREEGDTSRAYKRVSCWRKYRSVCPHCASFQRTFG